MHTSVDVEDAPLDLNTQLARLGRSWKWVAFFGAATAITGVLALMWPGHTLIALAVIFGIQLVLNGVFRLLGSLAADATGAARVVSAVLGLLSLLVGLYALRHIVITVVALGLVLGLYWVLDGVGALLVAVGEQGLPHRGLTVVSGITSIIAGIVLLSWPALSLVTLAVVTGIWLIVSGAVQLGIAFRLRDISRDPAAAGTS